MSDTISVGSNVSADVSAPGGMIVEEVGQIHLPDFLPRKFVLLNYTFAALGQEDGKFLIGELRTRGGDDWTLAAKSIISLNAKFGEDRKYLDLALVPKAGGLAYVIFLVEKKNKDKFLTAHNIKHGKVISLDEEFTSYDKVNVLGKGVTHIAADICNNEPTVFSISNLLRKLRLEDHGTNLKPTAARAQVPAEGQDGTLSLAVQSGIKSKSTNQSQPYLATVAVSFRTKSASKNKFMIEWYQSKKDELSCCKTPVKLGEHNEPSVLLCDPKDSRALYVLCVNRSQNTTSLHKLTKGRRHEEPIATFNYEVDLATMGMSAEQNVTLLMYDSSKDSMKIYTLQKTEGFRGRHPVCASCLPLEVLNSSAHVVSCVTTKWQINMNLVDQYVANNKINLALVTLVDPAGRYVNEPDSGHPYRLRVLGCETQGYSPISMILEDLERIFESAEEKVSSSTLKICSNSPPCRDAISQISAWLMSGRLANAELNYVKQGGSGCKEIETGSDRFTLKPISMEKFRGYITDIDWTQMNNQRQGTFTLEESATKSRIPTRLSMTSGLSQNSLEPISLESNDDESSSVRSKTPNNDLKNLVSGISDCLDKMNRDEKALNSNIGHMQNVLKGLQTLLDKHNDD